MGCYSLRFTQQKAALEENICWKIHKLPIFSSLVSRHRKLGKITWKLLFWLLFLFLLPFLMSKIKYHHLHFLYPENYQGERLKIWQFFQFFHKFERFATLGSLKVSWSLVESTRPLILVKVWNSGPNIRKILPIITKLPYSGVLGAKTNHHFQCFLRFIILDMFQLQIFLSLTLELWVNEFTSF